MEEKEILYKEIDLLIETIDDYKNEPNFSIEKKEDRIKSFLILKMIMKS